MCKIKHPISSSFQEKGKVFAKVCKPLITETVLGMEQLFSLRPLYTRTGLGTHDEQCAFSTQEPVLTLQLGRYVLRRLLSPLSANHGSIYYRSAVLPVYLQYIPSDLS